jgi:glyceraldehyde 3-phosphate dehydrogenase
VSAPIRLGMNGFGRMGRLALRVRFEHPDVQFVRVNELHGDLETCAHRLAEPAARVGASRIGT